jgi:hypothetical protein
MIITPIYLCRNCRTTYPGTAQEVANTPIEKLLTAARYTLGTPEHVFRIGGKVIQMTDLHQCSAKEVGLAHFMKFIVS